MDGRTQKLDFDDEEQERGGAETLLEPGSAGVEFGDESVDVEEFCKGTAAELREVFTAGADFPDKRSERRRKSKEFRMSLRGISERLREGVEVRDGQMRGFLCNDLRSEVTSAHRTWLEQQEILHPDLVESFGTEQGRIKFEGIVFNHLCSKGVLDLTIDDRLQGRFAGRDDFEKHLGKHLKGNYRLFKRILGSYHGGSVLDVLHGVADEIAANVPEDAEERAKDRAKERADLAGRIRERISEGTADADIDLAHYGIFSRFLAGGGDIVLKYAALCLLFSHPVIAAGLWSAKGITEAMGYDFGNLVKKLIKLPVTAPASIAHEGLNLLPASATQKLPRFVQRWITNPRSIGGEKVGRASLPWSARKQLFLRGLIPAPTLAGGFWKGIFKVLPDKWAAKVSEGVKKPEIFTEKVRPGELAQAEADKNESEIKMACIQVLQRYEQQHAPRSSQPRQLRRQSSFYA